jgi:hypothetical protein
MMWSEVSFQTESGDRAALAMRDEKLARAEVTLRGKRIRLPRNALSGVQIPVLSQSDLIYSSGPVGDNWETTVSLQVPVLDPALDVQDPNVSRQYQFVFGDGQLKKRVLEERRGTSWRTIEVKEF